MHDTTWMWTTGGRSGGQEVAEERGIRRMFEPYNNVHVFPYRPASLCGMALFPISRRAMCIVLRRTCSFLSFKGVVVYVDPIVMHQPARVLLFLCDWGMWSAALWEKRSCPGQHPYKAAVPSDESHNSQHQMVPQFNWECRERKGKKTKHRHIEIDVFLLTSLLCCIAFY